MMSNVHNLQMVEEFFNAIAYKAAGYENATFQHLSIKRGEAFCIHQARLMLNTGEVKCLPKKFESENVKAATYSLSEICNSPRELIDKLIEGSLSTPDGVLVFQPNESGTIGAIYDPLHAAGLETQAKFEVLSLRGGSVHPVNIPLLDWELKANATPYGTLADLAGDHLLGRLQDVSNIEVVAFQVAMIDPMSTITGRDAIVSVRLAHDLVPTNVTLGYMVLDKGRYLTRTFVSGNELKWFEEPDFQRGEIHLEVPPSSVLHCVASYENQAQHHYWVVDPSNAANPRRVIYELFDDKLENLNELLTKSQARGKDARLMETGVAWALWMLGFNVLHLGRNSRTQDAADLIALTPSGQVAVVECTTGLLKAEHKLPHVVERAENIRRRLDESGNRHLRILRVVVTSKTRMEVSAELETAEKHNVLVMTLEDLNTIGVRSATPPNADRLFEEAEATVKAAYEKQTALMLAEAQPV